MADWPDFLPCPSLDGVSYTPQTNVIRSQMDAGTAKMRRRFTSVPEDVTFSLVVDRGQMQALHDFVSITLGDVLPFSWREFRYPDLEYVAVYRFKSRPKYTPLGSDQWRADIELEMIGRAPQGTFSLVNEFDQFIMTSDDEEITT